MEKYDNWKELADTKPPTTNPMPRHRSNFDHLKPKVTSYFNNNHGGDKVLQVNIFSNEWRIKRKDNAMETIIHREVNVMLIIKATNGAGAIRNAKTDSKIPKA